MQRITGDTGPFQRFTTTSNGALTTTDTGTQALGGSTARNFGQVTFDSANSPNARVGATTNDETRMKNVGVKAYMRVK